MSKFVEKSAVWRAGVGSREFTFAQAFARELEPEPYSYDDESDFLRQKLALHGEMMLRIAEALPEDKRAALLPSYEPL